MNQRPRLRVPAALQSRQLVRHQRRLLAFAALFLAVMFPVLPYFRTEAHRFLLVLLVIYAVVGVALAMSPG